MKVLQCFYNQENAKGEKHRCKDNIWRFFWVINNDTSLEMKTKTYVFADFYTKCDVLKSLKPPTKIDILEKTDTIGIIKLSLLLLLQAFH